MPSDPVTRRIVALVFLCTLGVPAARAAPGDNHLASTNLATQKAAGKVAYGVSISDDGRYTAFGSAAGTLVAGDTNDLLDVFVHDRVSGVTERISVGFGGVETNGISLSPAISGNGRYVAFSSTASNLVAGGTDGRGHIFLRDRVTGVTTRVDVQTDGSDLPSAPSLVGDGGISDDGRYIAFTGGGDVYVRDTVARTTTLLVHTGLVPAPVISGDGRYVVYTEPMGPVYFIHDRATGSNEVLAGEITSEDPPEVSWRPAISRDGRWVAYMSPLSEVPADTNLYPDVYLLDRATGTRRLASVSATGAVAENPSFAPDVSDDGRYVSFRQLGAQLTPDASVVSINLFLKDMQTGYVETVAPLSPADDGISLSGDGTALAFITSRPLLENDINGSGDAYVHEVGAKSNIPAVYYYFLRPRSVDFGPVQVGATATRKFTLTNVGNTFLHITALELTGVNRWQYSLANTCRYRMLIGDHCTITVTFHPGSVGLKQAQLHVIAGGLERYRGLRGTGVAPP